VSSKGDHLTLLDACAVINFAASRHLEQIVWTIPGRVAITEIVEREALNVKSGGGGDDHDERERIHLASLVEGGHLEVLSPHSDDEYLTFINYAVELDDGEAMTFALAEHRNAIVVTDDRKAIRLAAQAVADLTAEPSFARRLVLRRRPGPG
jgi:predicted nucleic acid-binding protein